MKQITCRVRKGNQTCRGGESDDRCFLFVSVRFAVRSSHLIARWTSAEVEMCFSDASVTV